MVRSKIDKITRIVATDRIVGLICSLRPENICLGIVRCSTSARNITATTSSREVMKANRAPDIMPGVIRGIMTLTNVVQPLAPSPLAALIRERSKPVRVAVTVIITNGTPRVAWARMIPISRLIRPSGKKGKRFFWL